MVIVLIKCLFKSTLPILFLLSTMVRADGSEKIMVIPFSLDLDYSTPMAVLEMNGLRARFMIDTGSVTALHLNEVFMSQISGLVMDEGKERSTDATGEIFYNHRFHFPSLTVNGMTFKNIHGVSLTPWGLTLGESTNRPNTMVIGLNLFHDKVIRLDYHQRRVIVGESLESIGVKPSEEWVSLPLLMTADGIIVTLSIGGNDYAFILDTGASISVFWKDHLKSLLWREQCNILGDKATEDELNAADCVSLTLNDTGAKKVKTPVLLLNGNFSHLPFDGLLGTTFLDEYETVIDYPKQRLLIRTAR
ncbi:pepsin/retropepsin-like aspartic protease family protein [Budvicia aquatica]|uniref:Retroviral aspartyl protease n=1 Tax=Budvicia aquatica TaxID=82979 RepID=A0A2C6DSW0_9GAMM|nr:aspartyl protease family protein [Budvicia aquatica]PHI31565.1 hypothetical protein CRN84_20605 [Budvicia aquatica]VFS52078.1 Uncharacterised protein [Budvicia aquatica]